jgi:hypothetical protein
VDYHHAEPAYADDRYPPPREYDIYPDDAPYLERGRYPDERPYPEEEQYPDRGR